MIKVAWDVEEMVALVAVYMQYKDRPFGEQKHQLFRLSKQLNRRAELLRIEHDELFRNQNELMMMFMNLRYIDFHGTTGLSPTDKLMQDVWNMYHNDVECFQQILLEFRKIYQQSEQVQENENNEMESVSQKEQNASSQGHKYALNFGVAAYIDIHGLPLHKTWGEILNQNVDAWRNRKLEECIMSNRSLNCLRRSGYVTMSDILETTVFATATARGMGTKSFDELYQTLKGLENRGDFVPAEPNETYVETKFIINEELLGYRVQICAGEWSAIDSTQMSSESNDQLTKLKESYEIVGASTVQALMASAKAILNPLQQITQSINELLQFQGSLEQAIKRLPDSRIELQLSGFIYARDAETGTPSKEFSRYIIDNFHTFSDLRDRYYQIPNQMHRHLLSFVRWCAFDLNQELQKFLDEIKLKERDYHILKMRSQNATLNDVGNAFDLTRERVRQIERKITDRFARQQKKHHTLLKISALRNSDRILFFDELRPFLGEDADLFLYLFSIIPSEYYTYSRQSLVFSIGEDGVYQKVEAFVDELPDEIKVASLERLLDQAECEHGLPAELVQIKIEEQYKICGTVYFRGRLTYTEIYKRIMEKYYPEGLHVYNPANLEAFRQHIREDFGSDIHLPDNDRAISARLADVGILCGRGRYRPKKGTYISEELAVQIHDYIKNVDSPILLTNTIFSEFKFRLAEFGVDNKYYLQGILGELFRDDFYFSRDYISKDPNVTSLYSTIVSFIRKYEYPVEKSVIAKHFIGVPEIVLNFATADPHIINYFGEYMHIDRLKLRQDEKDLLHTQINELLSDGLTHTSRELYMYLKSSIPHLLQRCFVQFHFALFSLCECLFADDYQFKRPYIAKLDTEIIDSEEQAIAYLNSIADKRIDDLTNYVQTRHFRVNNILDLLDSFNDEYFILNHDQMVSIRDAGILETHCQQIEEKIKAEIKGCTPIRSLICIYDFPQISIKWTEWLIYSVLKKWSTVLEVEPSNNQFRFAIPLVAPKGAMTQEAIEQVGSIIPQNAAESDEQIDGLEDLVAEIMLEEGEFDDLL